MDGIAGAMTVDRRRRTVRHAVDADGPIEFDELVEYLDDPARETTPGAVDTDVTALRLHHVDLPKLDDADLVDYDHEAGRIEATETAGELRPLLDELDERDGPLRST